MRVIEDQDDDGKIIKKRWLQTEIGQGHTAKDRRGKLEPFEEPNLTSLISKLGFNVTHQTKSTGGTNNE